MTLDNFKSLFYSIQSSFICNFLLGIAMLYGTFWLPDRNIKNHIELTEIIALAVPLFIGILPALSYNLMRFRMVKSGELNYGMWRFAVSTVLPFIAPMLIYGIAYLNGFRLN